MRCLMLLTMLGVTLPAPAEESKSGKAAPAEATTSSVNQRIAELKTARDPFWPPGFKTGAKNTTVVEEPTDDLDLLALREGAKLNVQGRIKVGSKFLLMMRGRAVGQGDIIDVTGKNGKSHKMRIVSISQDNIQLEPVGL